jgi:hypothetical protein
MTPKSFYLSQKDSKCIKNASGVHKTSLIIELKIPLYGKRVDPPLLTQKLWRTLG